MARKVTNRQSVVVPFEDRQNVANRRLVERQLGLYLAMTRQTGQRAAVFCIRLDCDSDRQQDAEKGKAGELLKAFQARLPHVLPPSDQGGWVWRDGLVIAHASKENVYGMYRHVKSLLVNLERGLRRVANGQFPKLSLGIALYPGDGSTPSALLDHAHAAAVRAGGWDHNGFCFSSRSDGRQVADQLAIDVDLAQAIESDAIDMRLQPVLDLSSSCMIGAHALPVWYHPRQGDMSCSDILGVVGRAGLSGPYNAWLIDKICEQSRRWSRRSHRQRIGFDLARALLVDTHFAPRLVSALNDHGLPVEHMEVVIDAEALIEGTDHRLRTELRQLADLGLRLTVANIGIEPLPLDVFERLQVRSAQMAPHLVSTIGRSPSAEKALTALIGFMNTVGLRTRATGVDSEAQLEFLDHVGCDEAMGPLLAPLMKARDVDRLTSLRPGFKPLDRRDYSVQRLMHLH